MRLLLSLPNKVSRLTVMSICVQRGHTIISICYFCYPFSCCFSVFDESVWITLECGIALTRSADVRVALVCKPLTLSAGRSITGIRAKGDRMGRCWRSVPQCISVSTLCGLRGQPPPVRISGGKCPSITQLQESLLTAFKKEQRLASVHSG